MSSVKLTADSGGGTVELKAPATTASNGAKTWILPNDTGTAGQVLRNSSTAGTLEFGNSGWVKVFSTSTNDTSGDIAIENTSLFDGTYKRSMIVIYHSLGSNDGQEARIQVKLNGSYMTGANYAYHWRQRNSGGSSTVTDNSTGKTYIPIIESIGTAAGEGFSGTIEWNDSTSTTHWKLFNWNMSCGRTTGDIAQNIGNGGVNGTDGNTALTGIKLQMSGGSFGAIHYAGFGLTL